MRLARSIFVAVVFSSLGLLPSVAGAATSSPNIGGELLGILDGAFDPGPGGVQELGRVTVSGACNDSGPSTFSFTGSGSYAIGPYPGSFDVSGSFTFSSPDPTGTRTVTAFSENFTIHSTNGLVTGTKELDSTDPLPYTFPGGGASIGQEVADCTDHQIANGEESTRTYVSLLTTYSATIQTSEGTFTDRGRAITSLGQYALGPDETPYGDTYSEFFASDPVSPPPNMSPATVILTPPDAVNPVSTNHTVTATVDDASGAPVAGAIVLFSVRGSTATGGSCTTDATGTCRFGYQGPDLPGADLITACADNNSNGSTDPGEPCATATKAWALPTATSGQVTGGGQIYNATQTDKIAFGFTAKSDAGGIKGECSVVDPSTKTKVRCTDVTDLVETATHATLFGDATVNGTVTTYRMDVDDNAEPGAGKDTFKIHTASGYTSAGILTNGNIRIHA